LNLRNKSTALQNRQVGLLLHGDTANPTTSFPALGCQIKEQAHFKPNAKISRTSPKYATLVWTNLMRLENDHCKNLTLLPNPVHIYLGMRHPWPRNIALHAALKAQQGNSPSSPSLLHPSPPHPTPNHPWRNSPMREQRCEIAHPIDVAPCSVQPVS